MEAKLKVEELESIAKALAFRCTKKIHAGHAGMSDGERVKHISRTIRHLGFSRSKAIRFSLMCVRVFGGRNAIRCLEQGEIPKTWQRYLHKKEEY